jgi:CheY-like chemotaxis protein
VSAADGAKGLKVYYRNCEATPLVLVDLLSPPISAVEVIQALREYPRNSKIPAI